MAVEYKKENRQMQVFRNWKAPKVKGTGNAIAAICPVVVLCRLRGL
jgi:hypothetical protein